MVSVAEQYQEGQFLIEDVLDFLVLYSTLRKKERVKLLPPPPNAHILLVFQIHPTYDLICILMVYVSRNDSAS